MKSIRDYIKYYGNIPFSESPFNEIDNLIFSEIAYLNFDGIVPSLKKGTITMEHAAKRFFKKFSEKEIKKEEPPIRKVIAAFQELSTSKRFHDVELYNYVNVVDGEKQFGAICFRLPNDHIYVAFEGTDVSMVGWREDFQMAYQFPVPAQKDAIDYLNKVIGWRDRKIYVGGHSKGGNLAMIAAMYCKFSIRRKIIQIYNNDGPGFRKEQFESKAYQKMLPKLKMFVPENSIVGMIMRHTANYTVVKSSAMGVFQHDGMTWQCYGPFFIEGTRSDSSKAFEKRLISWLNKTDDEHRQKVVVTLFDLFERSGITLASQIRKLQLRKMLSLIKESTNLDRNSRELLLDTFKNILLEKETEVKEKVS